jgi:hypothetical protein
MPGKGTCRTILPRSDVQNPKHPIARTISCYPRTAVGRLKHNANAAQTMPCYSTKDTLNCTAIRIDLARDTLDFGRLPGGRDSDPGHYKYQYASNSIRLVQFRSS